MERQEKMHTNFLEYLTIIRRIVENDGMETFSKVHLVVGNEVCDLDSAVSALVYAFYLWKLNEDSLVAVAPVLNITSNDFRIKTEVKFVLSEQGIDHTTLLFSNSGIDPVRLFNLGKLVLTLINHQIPTGHFVDCEDAVVEIIDKHDKIDHGPIPKKVDQTVESVGSCATLVTEKLLNRPDLLALTPVTSLLLCETIVLQTGNFSSPLENVTQKDIAMADQLTPLFSTQLTREEIYHKIVAAQIDLSELTVEQILTKNKTVINSLYLLGEITICVMPLLCQNVFDKDRSQEALQQYCIDNQLVGIIVVGQADNHSPDRDILIYSPAKEVLRNVITLLCTPQDQLILKLTRDYSFPSIDSRYQYFRLGNATISSDQIIQLLRSHLQIVENPLVQSPDDEIYVTDKRPTSDQQEDRQVPTPLSPRDFGIQDMDETAITRIRHSSSRDPIRRIRIGSRRSYFDQQDSSLDETESSDTSSKTERSHDDDQDELSEGVCEVSNPSKPVSDVQLSANSIITPEVVRSDSVDQTQRMHLFDVSDKRAAGDQVDTGRCNLSTEQPSSMSTKPSDVPDCMIMKDHADRIPAHVVQTLASLPSQKQVSCNGDDQDQVESSASPVTGTDQSVDVLPNMTHADARNLLAETLISVSPSISTESGAIYPWSDELQLAKAKNVTEPGGIGDDIATAKVESKSRQADIGVPSAVANHADDMQPSLVPDGDNKVNLTTANSRSPSAQYDSSSDQTDGIHPSDNKRAQSDDKVTSLPSSSEGMLGQRHVLASSEANNSTDHHMIMPKPYPPFDFTPLVADSDEPGQDCLAENKADLIWVQTPASIDGKSLLRQSSSNSSSRSSVMSDHEDQMVSCPPKDIFSPSTLCHQGHDTDLPIDSKKRDSYAITNEAGVSHLDTSSAAFVGAGSSASQDTSSQRLPFGKVDRIAGSGQIGEAVTGGWTQFDDASHHQPQPGVHEATHCMNIVVDPTPSQTRDEFETSSEKPTEPNINSSTTRNPQLDGMNSDQTRRRSDLILTVQNIATKNQAPIISAQHAPMVEFGLYHQFDGQMAEEERRRELFQMIRAKHVMQLPNTDQQPNQGMDQVDSASVPFVREPTPKRLKTDAEGHLRSRAFTNELDQPVSQRSGILNGASDGQDRLNDVVVDAEGPAVLGQHVSPTNLTAIAPLTLHNQNVDTSSLIEGVHVQQQEAMWAVDMVAIQEYKQFLQVHMEPRDHGALVCFLAKHLPSRTVPQYHYVMQNIFRYFMSTLDLLADHPCTLVYCNGSVPAAQYPSTSWLHQCYKMLDRRMQKNLKEVIIVHPNFWFKAQLQTIGRTLLSTTSYNKIHYVHSLEALCSKLGLTVQELAFLDIPMDNSIVEESGQWTEKSVEKDTVNSIKDTGTTASRFSLLRKCSF